MNTATDPWIPVVTCDGSLKLASLCEVLTNGAGYADVAVRPHERVALMRLFLCVVHAALDGPKNSAEWRKAQKNMRGAVRPYLEKWKKSFDLFDKKRPWLQVADLSKTASGKDAADGRGDWTPVSKLNFSYATGNNTTLFDHSGGNSDRPIPLHETALSLLAFQCFSPGGLISQVYWNDKQTDKTSKDAPCVSASMIHAFIRGANLPETIILNLSAYDDVQSIYGTYPIGRPVWEMMPKSWGDSRAIENATSTYLGRLMPLTRFIHLDPQGGRMLLGNGLTYPTFIDGFPAEPSATVIVRKNAKERALLSYRQSKAIWRELGSIVVKRAADGMGGPLVLCSLQEGSDYDLLVAGLARDQATIIDTVESIFHISSRLGSPEGTAAYEAEVKNAESLAGRLAWAIETYRKTIDGGWSGRIKSAGGRELKAKLSFAATTYYWTAIEKNLDLLFTCIERIGTEEALPARERWRKKIFTAACEGYRASCARQTPRQMRAFAEGWNFLAGKQQETEHKESKETLA